MGSSAGLLLLLLVGVPGCGPQAPRLTPEQAVREALAVLGLDETALRVPRLDDNPSFARPGRLAAVDAFMEQPLRLLPAGVALAEQDAAAGPASSIVQAMQALGLEAELPEPGAAEGLDAAARWGLLVRAAGAPEPPPRPPARWHDERPFFAALRELLGEMARASEAWQEAGVELEPGDLEALVDDLGRAIATGEPTTERREMAHPAYSRLGEGLDLPRLAAALVGLAAAVERAAPVLAAHHASGSPLAWDTPLGRVRVASTRDERHSGDFALLIDPGGNDDYRDLARAIRPGQVSVVIDVAGNDEVAWEFLPGPGSGVLGIALWADLAGNDRYQGSNLGLGAGRLGAGLLWDAAGNDVYTGGSQVLGSGEYGLGVLADDAGDDVYGTHVMGQGFGGTGGIGLHLDGAGDDRYFCGGHVPDTDGQRRMRHRDPHFLSLCQGYAAGLRARQVSGGIGVLVDRSGNDRYTADIFAQGSAYLFGLGALVDAAGDDHYACFEHCQGEGLHASAGLLADADGDDVYEAHEHAQGTGVDRAVGILLDEAGDDRYTAERESQGAGAKRFGVGLLLDVAGADVYDAGAAAQGWAQPDMEEAPLGLLLDLGGEDVFRLPEVAPPNAEGRRQSGFGLAIDRP